MSERHERSSIESVPDNSKPPSQSFTGVYKALKGRDVTETTNDTYKSLIVTR